MPCPWDSATVILVLVVVDALALTCIVATGFGKDLGFHHVVPTLVDES